MVAAARLGANNAPVIFVARLLAIVAAIDHHNEHGSGSALNWQQPNWQFGLVQAYR